MDIVMTIVTVIQGVATLITLLILLSDKFRSFIFGKRKEKENSEQEKSYHTEATRSLLRNEITHIYYKNLFNCEIRSYEYENVSYLYNSYKNLGGNSYIDKIWEEMQNWKIIP